MQPKIPHMKIFAAIYSRWRYNISTVVKLFPEIELETKWLEVKKRRMISRDNHLERSKQVLEYNWLGLVCEHSL